LRRELPRPPTHNAQQGHAEIEAAWRAAKPWLLAGHALELEVRPARRNTEQNAKLHAEIGEIAATVEWAGKKRDPEVWKRLLTAAWLRARGESIEILPALDGHGIDVVFKRTSSLTKGECAELIEFVMAWKAERMQTGDE
jgi:hypothetical protein